MRTDIFPHFLNRDSRQISGLFRLFDSEQHHYWLKAGLNISAVLCENNIVVPPGFNIECDISFSVIEEQIEFLTEGLVSISLRENNLLELIEKKRSEYLEEKDIYPGLFDDTRAELIAQSAISSRRRNFSAGKAIAKSWRESVDSKSAVWKPLQSVLSYNTLSIIGDIPKNLTDEGKAATWAAISKKLPEFEFAAAPYLRAALQHEYFKPYVKAYNLNIVKQIPYITDDFNIKPRDKIYLFPKFKACLEALYLYELILEASAPIILYLRSQPIFVDLIDAYSQLALRHKSAKDIGYLFGIASEKANINWVDEARRIALLASNLAPSDLDTTLDGISQAVCWIQSEFNLDKRASQAEQAQGIDTMGTKISSEIDVAVVVAAPQELNYVREFLTNKGIKIVQVPKLAGLDGELFTVEKNDNTLTCAGLFLAQSKGKASMQELIHQIYKFHSPKAVIMVGMMAGIKGKCNLLDVVSPAAVHDVTAIGTNPNGIVIEPEPSRMHPYLIHFLNQYNWSTEPATFQIKGASIIAHKKTLCVPAKWDDIANEICQKALEIDPENIIGLEMEGSALSEAQHNELITGDSNVHYLMLKGVADYAGETIDPEEKLSLSQFIDMDTGQDYSDPTNDNNFKKELQRAATFNSTEVLLRIIRDSLGEHIT